MLKLAPIGGLGNRLRQILSYRAKHGPLEVLWANSDAVSHGAFLDVFQPLDGVTFTYAGEGHGHEVGGADIVAWTQVADGAPAGWEKGYAEIRPQARVLARVAELQAQIGGPYVAIHARRCDHVNHAPTFGHFTSDEELLAWWGRRYAEWPYALYLATDSAATIEFFRQRLAPGTLHTHRIPEAVHGYEVRPGTLFDAAVDMFTCAAGAAFQGSWMSSFTEAIRMIRWKGEPPGGFVLREHMPSADGEWYRNRPDRAAETLAKEAA
jgi:hypothetical protein